MTTYINGLETALDGQVKVSSGVVQVNRQSEWANMRGKEVYDASEYATLAATITAAGADAKIYVPPQTFSEAVTISSNNVTMYGAGRTSLIDGAATGTAITASGDDIVIENLTINTTGGSGNSYYGINFSGSRITASKVTSLDCDDRTFMLTGGDSHIISNCISLEHDVLSVQGASGVDYNRITGNIFTGTRYGLIYIAEDYTVCSNNILTTSANTYGLTTNSTANFVVMSGNTVNMSNATIESGIWPAGNNSTVTGNVVNCVSAAVGDAIDLHALSDDCNVVGNCIDLAVRDGGTSNAAANNEVF